MILYSVIILKIILLVFLLYVFCIYPGKVKNFKLKYYHTHRGYFSKDQKIPENSMLAFENSIKHNYGIELDIQVSKDGVVYVFHDDDLNRMCGVDKMFYDLNSYEIDELLIFNERIPRFKDVLNLVEGQVPLIVELKSTIHNKILCKNAVTLLKNYTGEFSIESFDPTILIWFKKHEPTFIRGQLISQLKDYHDHKLFGFMIMRLFFNFLTRPHYVAVDCEIKRKIFSHQLYKFLGGKLVTWTVHMNTIIPKNYFDAIIFEHFDPNESVLGGKLDDFNVGL